MKFKWEYDPHTKEEINLHDLDGNDHSTKNVVGWVRQVAAKTDEYEMRFVWCDYDEREDIRYNTKREVMRALRTAYRMYIIGGGKLNEFRPT